NFFVVHGDYARPTAHESTITEEFRLSGNVWGDRVNWQAGSYFEFARPLGLSGLKTALEASCKDFLTLTSTNPLALTTYGAFGLGGNLSVNQTETSYRDVGLYAQATVKITKQLKATGGFRWTWDSERWDVFSFDTPFLDYPAYGLSSPTVCTGY